MTPETSNSRDKAIAIQKAIDIAISSIADILVDGKSNKAVRIRDTLVSLIVGSSSVIIGNAILRLYIKGIFDKSPSDYTDEDIEIMLDILAEVAFQYSVITGSESVSIGLTAAIYTILTDREYQMPVHTALMTKLSNYINAYEALVSTDNFVKSNVLNKIYGNSPNLVSTIKNASTSGEVSQFVFLIQLLCNRLDSIIKDYIDNPTIEVEVLNTTNNPFHFGNDKNVSETIN